VPRPTPPISNQIAGVHATYRSMAIPNDTAAQQITNGWRGVVGDEIGPLSLHGYERTGWYVGTQVGTVSLTSNWPAWLF
jgi:hypothetical protein